MRTDLWLQGVIIVLAVLGASLGVFPAFTITKPRRVLYSVIFVGLCIAQFYLYILQSSEAETERRVTQEKLEESEKGHEFLKDQQQASLKQQETSLKQQKISINQQQVLEVQNRDLREQVGIVQQKLDQSSAENRDLRTRVLVLQDQNRDLDAQIVSIRKRFGISTEFRRDVIEQLGIQTDVGVTVEKGPAQTEKENLPK